MVCPSVEPPCGCRCNEDPSGCLREIEYYTRMIKPLVNFESKSLKDLEGGDNDDILGPFNQN